MLKFVSVDCLKPGTFELKEVEPKEEERMLGTASDVLGALSVLDHRAYAYALIRAKYPDTFEQEREAHKGTAFGNFLETIAMFPRKDLDSRIVACCEKPGVFSFRACELGETAGDFVIGSGSSLIGAVHACLTSFVNFMGLYTYKPEQFARERASSRDGGHANLLETIALFEERQGA